MLEALSDDLCFRIIDYLAQHGDAHSTELASELNATKDQVSKRIKTLVDAGLVTRGRPQTLIFPDQTLRTLDEIGRLQILSRRQLLADVEDPYYGRAWMRRHPEGYDTHPDEHGEFPRTPEIDIRWQVPTATPRRSDEDREDKRRTVTLLPEDGVLVHETEPWAVLNREYFGFRLVVGALTVGDLEMSPERAIARASWAVEKLVPRTTNRHHLSHHRGWLDATHDVYGDHKRLVEQLRKYVRTGSGSADDS
jgi:hypothetical protein